MDDPPLVIWELGEKVQAEIREVIRLTKPFNTSLSDEDEGPRTFFRKKKSLGSRISIKKTISRDRSERELPEVSFTSADLGASLLVRDEFDRAAVYSRNSRGLREGPGGSRLSGRSGLSLNSEDTPWSSEPMDEVSEVAETVSGKSDSSRSSSIPRNSVHQVEEAALEALMPKEAISSDQNVEKNRSSPSQWPWKPSGTLRRRHSSRGLGEALDMKQDFGKLPRDRTYLELVTGQQLFGSNPASSFFSSLMDEINKLRKENEFLMNQLASLVSNKNDDRESGFADKAVNPAPVSRRRYKVRRSSSFSEQRVVYSRQMWNDDGYSDGIAPSSNSIPNRDGLPNQGAEAPPDSPTLLSSHLDGDPQNPRIYHKVHCTSRESPGHGRHYCLDPPTRPPVSAARRRQNQHLQENTRVSELDSILRRSSNVSFVVVKLYDCGETSRRWRLGHASKTEALSRDRVTADEGDNEVRSVDEYIIITSNILQLALDEVAQCAYTERSLKNDMPQPKLTAPYFFIYHHRSLLERHASERRGSVEKAINDLLDYFQKKYGEDYEAADRLFKRGLVSSEHLWKLFRPNTLLCSSGDVRSSAFALASWPTGYFNNLNLQCWSWKYDGSLFQRLHTSVEVFCEGNEPIPIRDLKMYPLKFAENDVQDRLKTRGKQFWDLRYQGMICYNGLSVEGTEEHVDTRFMVDDPLHRKYHPTSKGLMELHSAPSRKMDPFDKWPLQCSRDQLMGEDTLPLMPDKLRGFNLDSKEWEELYVEGTSAIQWHKKAFERLVLPPRMKDLLKAMIVNRKRDKNSSDIFYGKGKGLIMLLHGGPGTGKTLSAELTAVSSVAEIAEKPLYRVTCGDIGTEIDEVERYLEEILSLAKRWDCVLLLDEADVFLEERGLTDLKRNSLVSVFLRVLEYYDGILILTSNRVGVFDEAFKSRIQVALHYENLAKSARKKIWNNFLEMLEEDETDANFSDLERHLDDLASVEMNGRQIRNAVTTARQLSAYKNETLEYEHLEQVLKTAGDFNRYIEKVHGHPDDKWAREEGLR